MVESQKPLLQGLESILFQKAFGHATSSFICEAGAAQTLITSITTMKSSGQIMDILLSLLPGIILVGSGGGSSSGGSLSDLLTPEPIIPCLGAICMVASNNDGSLSNSWMEQRLLPFLIQVICFLAKSFRNLKIAILWFGRDVMIVCFTNKT